MGRFGTVPFIIWTVTGLVAGCSATGSPTVSTPTSTATPRNTLPRPVPTFATPVGTRQLKTTIICFSRLSFPEDEEGLRTQIGPRAGIESLSIEMNNTMTVTYDPALTSREQIALAAKNLGFSVVDEPCP